MSLLLLPLLLCSSAVVLGQDGGESPSDFPYHSFLCDQIEIEEFVAEQEKCYAEKEALFAEDSSVEEDIINGWAEYYDYSWSMSSESKSTEEELEQESGESEEESGESGDEEEEDGESDEKEKKENIQEKAVLRAAYDVHCKEIEAKLSCITDNSHKCYNKTQVDGIVFNYLMEHFYPFYHEAESGLRELLPLCDPLRPYEDVIVYLLTGRGLGETPEEPPCTFELLADIYYKSSQCYDEAYKLMLSPGDFVSFFPNSKELRTLRQCRGARQMIGECQEAFAECYAKELMGEVRLSGDQELAGVAQMISEYDGEEFDFEQKCGGKIGGGGSTSSSSSVGAVLQVGGGGGGGDGEDFGK